MARPSKDAITLGRHDEGCKGVAAVAGPVGPGIARLVVNCVPGRS